MFRLFSAGQEDTANHGNVSAGEVDDAAWSEDPQEKVVQLTRQLKVARGQLDKKSDFCDELADQLRRLEEDLEARDSAQRETRALLNATGAEFRAAAHTGATERQEYAQDSAVLRDRLGSLESEVEDLRKRSQENSVLATSWIEREGQLQRGEAELESQVRTHAVKLSRLSALLSDEEASAAALSTQLTEGREHFEAELRQAELEKTRQLSAVEEAAQVHIAGESASFAQRIRAEAAELESALSELCAARSEGAESLSRLQHCEEAAVSQESSTEQALRLMVDEKAASVEKATTLGSALENCRAELQASEAALRADLNKQIEMCSQLRTEHAKEAAEARKSCDEFASCRASLDESREEVAKLRSDIKSRCEALRMASSVSEERHTELQDTRKNLLAECAATSKSFSASEETLASRVRELTVTEEALQQQTANSKKLSVDIDCLKAAAKHEAASWKKSEQHTCKQHADVLSASQTACSQWEQKANKLQSHVEELKAEVASKAAQMYDLTEQIGKSESKQRSAAAEAERSEKALRAEMSSHASATEHCTVVTQQLEEHRAAATAAAAQTATDNAQLTTLVRDLREQLENAAGREKELSAALEQEKELHENAMKLLQHQRADNISESNELQQELEHMSSELEQKEEDMLSTHFDMVTLQNKLNDQMQELTSNTEALHQSKEQLAEKDEKLRVALRRQDELVTQMNDACTRLQEKVARLTQELEGSRSSYQALDEQSRAVISRLENDRESLKNEVAHVRAELQGVTAQNDQARLDAAERLEAMKAKLSAELADATSTAEAARKAAEQAEAEKERLKAEMAKREVATTQEHALLSARCEAAEKETTEANKAVEQRASQIQSLQTRLDDALVLSLSAADQHKSELERHSREHVALFDELVGERNSAGNRDQLLLGELHDSREQTAHHERSASALEEALTQGRDLWTVELAEARAQRDQEVATVHAELKQNEDAAAAARVSLESELRSACQSADQRTKDLETQEATTSAARARLEESLRELNVESRRSEHLAQCVDDHVSRHEIQTAELKELQGGHAAMQQKHQEAAAELIRNADEEKGSLIQKSERAAAEVDRLRDELQNSAQALRAAQSSAEDEARKAAMQTAGWKTEETQLAEVRRASAEQAAALELLTSQASSLERTVEARLQEVTTLRDELAEHSSRSQRQVAQVQAALQRSEAEGVSLQEQMEAREAELQHALGDARKRMEKHAIGAADEAALREKKLAEQVAAQQQREITFAESLRLEGDKARELQERMLEAVEGRDAAEDRLRSCEAALERSRLLERQALEKAQELRTSLYLYREFGREDFMQATPRAAAADVDASSAEHAGVDDQPAGTGTINGDKEGQDSMLEGPMSSNLITVELDLGLKSATVSVAIWQTRGDFDTIVEEFLKENRVKPIFKDPLVKYLMEVEDEATTLPISVKANLADIYSRHA